MTVWYALILACAGITCQTAADRVASEHDCLEVLARAHEIAERRGVAIEHEACIEVTEGQDT